MFCVYQIHNMSNGKVYIGVTGQTPRARFRAHLSKAKSGNFTTYFDNSIRKYGPDSFAFRVLEYHATVDTAYEREKYWIVEKKSLSPAGYNSNGGGKGGASNPSQETRRRMSLAKKDYIPWNKDPKSNVTASYKREKCVFDISKFGVYLNNQ